LLGFSELMNGWSTPGTTFVDIETVEEIFRKPLPRHINIFQLPETGLLFESDKQVTHKRLQARTTALRVNPKRSQNAANKANSPQRDGGVIELPTPSQEIPETSPSV
jgi:hypothetical protein